MYSLWFKVVCIQGLSSIKMLSDVHKSKQFIWTIEVNGTFTEFQNIGLRTYTTKYFTCWKLFNTLHTVCFMHGLSTYEIKRICHRAYLFITSSRNFQHLTNFLNIWKNNTCLTYRAKIVVIFSQLLSINLNYYPWPKTLRNCLFVISSFDKILHDIFWQFVKNLNLFLE